MSRVIRLYGWRPFAYAFNAEENCGTGAGGFKPGNTCGSGKNRLSRIGEGLGRAKDAVLAAAQDVAYKGFTFIDKMSDTAFKAAITATDAMMRPLEEKYGREKALDIVMIATTLGTLGLGAAGILAALYLGEGSGPATIRPGYAPQIRWNPGGKGFTVHSSIQSSVPAELTEEARALAKAFEAALRKLNIDPDTGEEL